MLKINSYKIGSHLSKVATIKSLLFLLSTLITSYASTASAAQQGPLSVTLTLPNIQDTPYHRPFVAVWLEDENRNPLATLAVWYDDETWLKDMRQWWRKLGRDQLEHKALDGLSGATRRPGQYTLTWNGKDHSGTTTTTKTLLVNIEVVREEGDRSYIRHAIQLEQPLTINIDATGEIGDSTITIYKSQKPERLTTLD